MKTITIGRVGCDIILSDDSISRNHATITLVNGQYLYNDISKNGTLVNGRVYKNETIVLAPGTPVYLSGKVPLPWPQVLMLLSDTVVADDSPVATEAELNINDYNKSNMPLNIGIGVLSFIVPLVGFILFFVWKKDYPLKAKQALVVASISFGIRFTSYIILLVSA